MAGQHSSICCRLSWHIYIAFTSSKDSGSNRSPAFLSFKISSPSTAKFLANSVYPHYGRPLWRTSTLQVEYLFVEKWAKLIIRRVRRLESNIIFVYWNQSHQIVMKRLVATRRVLYTTINLLNGQITTNEHWYMSLCLPWV